MGREREEIMGFDGDAELLKEIVLGFGFVENLEHKQRLRIAIDKPGLLLFLDKPYKHKFCYFK